MELDVKLAAQYSACWNMIAAVCGDESASTCCSISLNVWTKMRESELVYRLQVAIIVN